MWPAIPSATCWSGRDSSALGGSIGVTFLALPPAAVLLSLPSNLLDTTEVEQMTHEVRVRSNDDSAFQWQAGVFYSNIKRDYAQRRAHARTR